MSVLSVAVCVCLGGRFPPSLPSRSLTPPLTQLMKSISDKHEEVMARMGAIMAAGERSEM